MATHKISVTVEKDTIQVTPDPLIMTSADEVHWSGTNARRFSVVFDAASPFEEREFAHARATAKQRPRARGRFKYSVVSEEDTRLRLDPVIIVEEPPTGPTP